MEIDNGLIQKHLKHDIGSGLRSSAQYYAETGHVSGGLLLAIKALLKEQSQLLRPMPSDGEIRAQMEAIENISSGAGDEHSGIIKSHYFDLGAQYVLSRMRDMVGIRAAEKTAWIPVSERLPEPMHTVIVWKGQKHRYVVNGFVDKKGVWRCSDDKGCWYPHENVTHWQPLPAAPDTDKK